VALWRTQVGCLLLCALVLCPTALASTAATAPAAPEGPASAGSNPPGGNSLPLPLRIPDFDSLDHSPDRPVSVPPPSRSPQAVPGNWTVLVYMVADNNLEPFAIQDLNEMELALPAPGVTVVVEVDRSTGYDTSNGDWTGARRYLIRPDGDPSTVTSTMLSDLGELDMGDPQTLADFLSWGFDTYPASHYLVVLWDHGFGWSGGFGNDFGDNDHLSISELSQALEAADTHLGRPIDVLAFDACLMQEVEVAYELAWLADFLVAAQDLEPAAGWPYDAMLRPLHDNPSIAPEAFASELVLAYMGAYGLAGEAVMSATRLSAVRTTLADALNALALQLAQLAEDPNTASSTSAQRAMMDARDSSPPMFNRDLVDLGEFTRHLAEDGRLPDAARQAAAAAREALNASIVDEGHSVYRDPLSGMSIYVPSLSVPQRYATTRFAAEGYWDEFLVALLFGVPAGGVRPTIQVLAPSEGISIARLFSASLSSSSSAGSALTLQFKAGWADFIPVGSGPSPLLASATLDALKDGGPAVLTFRAVDASGRPSLSIERHASVEAYPVTLAPALRGLALAVNRTTTVTLVATPRAPFQAFDIAWLDLPAGVSGAQTTSFVSLPTSPPPPFNITLVLAVDGSASEGSFPGRLVVRPSAAPSVVTFFELDLTITRPLPDIAMLPLNLSDELPLPGEVVTVSTRVSNLGFENVSLVRVVAEFTDALGNLTELSNTTLGPLAQGDSAALSVNFTAGRGTQRIAWRAAPEPALEELALLNNAQERTVVVVNLSVALSTPLTPRPATLGNSSVPVPYSAHNLGTDADTYSMAVTNRSHLLLQVGLPSASLALAGRSSTLLAADVLLPPTAEGGDEFSFTILATSQTNANISASIVIVLQVEEVYNASVRAQPNEVILGARGSSQVTVLLRNLGNGHEAFALAIEGGDPALGASLDQADFLLAPGAAAAPRLSLTDKGLVHAERPYTLEVVAVSQTSGLRFSAILSVSVEAAPNITIEPLEPHLDAGANGSATFHFRVANAGNTHLIAALSAASREPGVTLNLSAQAVLLEPGASAVVNGTAVFAEAPLSGTYLVNISASDAQFGTNATNSFDLEVPRIHDLHAGVTVAPSPGARTLARTITISNLGNTAELVTVDVGYVPVSIPWSMVLPNGTVMDPPNAMVLVPPRSNFTFSMWIGPLESGASGAIEVLLRPEAAGALIRLSVAYSFEAPPSSPLLGWVIVALVGAGAIAAWVFATRPGKPGRPPAGP
jgi:hypothetical protein